MEQVANKANAFGDRQLFRQCFLRCLADVLVDLLRVFVINKLTFLAAAFEGLLYVFGANVFGSIGIASAAFECLQRGAKLL